MNITTFKGSQGWLTKFKERHNIVFDKVTTNNGGNRNNLPSTSESASEFLSANNLFKLSESPPTSAALQNPNPESMIDLSTLLKINENSSKNFNILFGVPLSLEDLAAECEKRIQEEERSKIQNDKEEEKAISLEESELNKNDGLLKESDKKVDDDAVTELSTSLEKAYQGFIDMRSYILENSTDPNLHKVCEYFQNFFSKQ